MDLLNLRTKTVC